MPQRLKDEVQQQIDEAALAIFARKGFLGATMAEIGQAAGISTGNIYRYYRSKEVLFNALIGEAFANRFVALVRRRVRALDGVDDYRVLGPQAAWHVASGELLEFCIQNRLRVIILLARAEGTRFEGFGRQMVERLFKGAVAHFAELRPQVRLTRTLRFNLERIYENLLGTTVRLLERFAEPEAIRQGVQEYSRYHLAGLKDLFAQA